MYKTPNKRSRKPVYQFPARSSLHYPTFFKQDDAPLKNEDKEKSDRKPLPRKKKPTVRAEADQSN